MSTRDPQAERYNRRTRAIEKQANALDRIADALHVQALAAAADADTAELTWTKDTANDLLDKLIDRAERL